MGAAAGVANSNAASPAADRAPMKRPTPTGRIDCDRTSRVTSQVVAPSAMRTPISLVRCSTRYDSTLNRPDSVSARASPPSATVNQNAICSR